MCMQSDQNPMQVERAKLNIKFKIMLCGVQLSTVKIIHTVLRFAGTLSPEVLNNDERLTVESLGLKETCWQELHPLKLLSALRYACQFKYIDTDLTTDYGGTLHIPRLEEAIRAGGGECAQHQCGRNMIRQAPIATQLGGSVNLVTQAKFYNKVSETLSSSSARSREIGQKLHYLLNASTPILRDTFRQFHMEGVSRFETTHSSADNSGAVPALDDMLKIHESLAGPLSVMWKETMVQSSIQNHIRQLERAADCSVATLFPHMGCLKKSSLKKGEISTAKANKEPEGCLLHFYNSVTGKFIGNMIHSQLKRYGSTRTEGFQLLAQNLAWGSLCRQPPVVAICVAGPGKCLRDGEICTAEGFDVTRALWFRLMYADVVVGGPTPMSDGAVGCSNESRRMWLAGHTGSYSDKGSLRFCDTDMQLIGVDVNSLDNLRISVLDNTFEPSYENMGRLQIRLRPLTAGQNTSPRELASGESQSMESLSTRCAAGDEELLEGESTCSSDVRRLVAGVEARGRLVSIGTLPKMKVRVQRYYDQTSPGHVMRGQKKEGRTLVILAGGDKYKIPDHASNGLFEAIKKHEALGI